MSRRQKTYQLWALHETRFHSFELIEWSLLLIAIVDEQNVGNITLDTCDQGSIVEVVLREANYTRFANLRITFCTIVWSKFGIERVQIVQIRL